MTIVSRGIQGLRDALGEMAAAAQDVLDRVTRAVEGRESTTPERIRAADAHLNQLELKLDHMCETLLALRDPYAVDFRTVFGAIKTTRDLERIGDECKVVARWASDLPAPVAPALVALAGATREEVADAVLALRLDDAQRARAVLQGDRALDRLEGDVLDRTSSVAEAFVAHALERIGDLATNIAENVIYVVEAEDVRHRKDAGG